MIRRSSKEVAVKALAKNAIIRVLNGLTDSTITYRYSTYDITEDIMKTDDITDEVTAKIDAYIKTMLESIED